VRKKDNNILIEEIGKAILAEARKSYSPKVVKLFQHPKNMGVVDKPNGFGVGHRALEGIDRQDRAMEVGSGQAAQFINKIGRGNSHNFF